MLQLARQLVTLNPVFGRGHHNWTNNSIHLSQDVRFKVCLPQGELLLLKLKINAYFKAV